MKRLVTLLAYTAAALTIVAAILTPFVLMPWFTRGVAALGLHTDAVYSGGDVAYSLEKPGYRIVVYHPVVPTALLSGSQAFVQIAWEPASALPARVADEVDLDGDGRPDLVATFAVPRDANAELRADVMSKSPRVASMRGIARQSFTSAIVRVGDRIVLRIPLNRQAEIGRASCRERVYMPV
jgi:hypothetical protein